MNTLTGLDVAVSWLRGDRAGKEQAEAARIIRTARFGLVTNPSASTRDLEAAPDVLRAAGAKVTSLFGPEHGVRGEVADGVKIAHGMDRRTGLKMWSLYGETNKPTLEMLQGLEALVFDIQDVGARFYTFTSTLSHVMTAAKEAKLPVVILDRPNPIGGSALEGPILEPQHKTFVGLHPIPIRHGATMGELGRLWAKFGAGEDPLIVRCKGWDRSHLWPETGLEWITPSPNMPNFETALVYPGMCLFEGTNVSEGRGTTLPFRCIGAPWVDPEALADALNAEGLPGARFRPARFIPSASKHRGVNCSGVQVHITDADAFQPVATGVATIAAIKKLFPEFAWLKSGERWAVDRLAGTTRIREAIDAGQGWRRISDSWREDVAKHRTLLREIRIYE